MRLKPVDGAKRVVGHAYAERVAAPGTLAKIHKHEREYDEWKARALAAQRANRRMNARMVIGAVMTNGIIAISLAVLWSWWNYTEDGYCGQLGVGAGGGTIRAGQDAEQAILHAGEAGRERCRVQDAESGVHRRDGW